MNEGEEHRNQTERDDSVCVFAEPSHLKFFPSFESLCLLTRSSHLLSKKKSSSFPVICTEKRLESKSLLYTWKDRLTEVNLCEEVNAYLTIIMIIRGGKDYRANDKITQGKKQGKRQTKRKQRKEMDTRISLSVEKSSSKRQETGLVVDWIRKWRKRESRSYFLSSKSLLPVVGRRSLFSVKRVLSQNSIDLWSKTREAWRECRLRVTHNMNPWVLLCPFSVSFPVFSLPFCWKAWNAK